MARTAEALGAMKLLKACSWEEPFARRVRDARNAELRQLRVTVGLQMLFGVLWECVPLLVRSLVACAVAFCARCFVAFRALALGGARQQSVLV